MRYEPALEQSDAGFLNKVYPDLGNIPAKAYFRGTIASTFTF